MLSKPARRHVEKPTPSRFGLSGTPAGRYGNPPALSRLRLRTRRESGDRPLSVP